MSDQGQSALESALIGCFGGLFATFCVYPLDLAKSKVSAHIRRKDDKGPKVTSIEVLKKILAEKGAAGLYEGMGGRALQCFVEDFVFFWWYSSLKTYAQNRVTRKEGRARPLTITEGLVTGAIAGVINNACTIPFDVVATNHQISGLDRNKKNGGGKGNAGNKKESTIQGLVATAREVYAKGGAPAFWAGLGPSCLLVVNPAINFAAFDRLKLLYNRGFKGGKGRKLTANEAANMSLGPLEAFFIGAASKAIATSITFPLIRAKVLMMSADKENAGKKGKKDNNKKDDGRKSPGRTDRRGRSPSPGKDLPSSKPDGLELHRRIGALTEKVRARLEFVEVLNDAIKAEGIGGLYKGLGVQLSRSAVAAAIMFMTREQLDALTAGTLRRIKQSVKA